MRKAICPLCGGCDNEKCFSERGYNVLSCKTCELFFVYPYATDVYRKVSTGAYDAQVWNPSKQHAASRLYYTGKYFQYIKNECAGAGSILDVGCGTGALLELLGESLPNIERVGIELNAERAAFARRVAQCEIYQKPVEELPYGKRFDVITMINVLSHIPSLNRLFASLHTLIAAEGKLILKVGEMTHNVKKDAVFDWSIPEHLHFLGMTTIQYICKKHHFMVVRHERQPLSLDLFSCATWMAPGKSSVRNVLKRAVSRTPFALPLLRRLYDARHGGTIFSSYIVLSPTIHLEEKPDH